MHQKHALQATGIGAGANLLLAGSKGVAGYAVGSTALIADCFNSFGDLFSDAVVYYTVTQARRTATPERPWGQGKYEPLGAFAVGGLLALTGAGIGYTAFHAALEIVHTTYPTLLDVFSSTNTITSSITIPSTPLPPALDTSLAAPAGDLTALPTTPTPPFSFPMGLLDLDMAQYAALGVTSVSIGVKEVLFRYTLHAGMMANSAVVVANAWQHRSDVAISSAVLIGLTGSMAGYPILDPVVGVLVGGIIIRQAWLVGMKSLRDLSDAPASKEETYSLRDTVLRVPGIEKVVDLKARQSGPFLYVECTVGVNGEISASSAHRLASLVRIELLRTHEGRVANSVVHVTPLGSSGLGEQTPQQTRSHTTISDEVRRILLAPGESKYAARLKQQQDQQKLDRATRASIALENNNNNNPPHPPPVSPPPQAVPVALEQKQQQQQQQQQQEEKSLASDRWKESDVTANITHTDTSGTSINTNNSTMNTKPVVAVAVAVAVDDGHDHDSLNWAVGPSSTGDGVGAGGDDVGVDESCQRTEEEENDDLIRHISSVSEVQVYYRDDGRVAVKVDVYMDPNITIRKANLIAIAARKRIESKIAGLAEVDVDLELDER